SAITENMEKIKTIIQTLLPFAPFDAIGVGVIDFKKNKFDALEANTFESVVKFSPEPYLYFDLASLTKPLTNSLSYFLRPDLFDQNFLLLLNHRAGLPAWGQLPNPGWKEQILNYEIK